MFFSTRPVVGGGCSVGLRVRYITVVPMCLPNVLFRFSRRHGEGMSLWDACDTIRCKDSVKEYYAGSET